jgi:predicted transcriptional regulator
MPAGEPYPKSPGFKGTDTETSEAAAQSMKADAPTLRDRCFEQLRQRPMTADEVARSVGRDILSVRPRICELKKLGLIVPTGDRRQNGSGKRAVVWMVIPGTGQMRLAI